MDELAKKVQEKYIEDLTCKYPLHRFDIIHGNFLYVDLSER